MAINREGKIAVLMGGSGSEREISLKSGSAVLAGLRSAGFDAHPLDPKDGIDALIADGFDAAFIALHGAGGEDGCMQGMLEILKIPYTGSGVLASAAAMDKAFAKDLMLCKGIPTADYQVFHAPLDKDAGIDLRLECPLIVKPASEGSTVGICRVDDDKDIEPAMKEAFKYDNKVLVEKYIEGREVTVGVLDGEILPIVEVRPKSGFYDYESKYTKGMTEYIVPADFDADEVRKMNDIALSVYELFRCKGAARVDIIINGDGPFVLEINTVPGMTETSLLPMAALDAGIGFSELVARIMNGASLDAFGSANKA
ncbi:MAG: D-alanine--D-alanine ligase [bacterium]|nr:D-alanine--D-alanine ligase [bacterium]